MLFQQLFEPITSTYTYLLADSNTREGILIDSVLETFQRDLTLIKDLEIRLLYVIDTHVHADHVTGAGKIADATGAKIGLCDKAKATGVDLRLKDGDVLKFGKHEIKIIATPGHTNSCLSFYTEGRVFTGDALMIRGNGRTDFQEGSAETLYHSIHSKLFSLPGDTVVYPAHDYKGFTSSTIESEKKLNLRLGGNRTLTEFIEIMKNLNLPKPAKIDLAVPANLKSGRI